MSNEITAKQFAEELRLVKRVLTKTRTPQEFADIMNYEEFEAEEIMNLILISGVVKPHSTVRSIEQTVAIKKASKRKRSHSNTMDFNKKAITDALDESKTKEEAAEKLNCCVSVLYRKMKNLGITGYVAGGKKAKSNKPIEIGEEELYVEAVVKGKSVKELANNFRCSKTAINKYLKKYKTRTTKKFKHKETVRVIKDVPGQVSVH